MANTFYKLVHVPRAHYGKYVGLFNAKEMDFAGLVAAAERGDDGLSVTDSDNFGGAFFREGDSGGMLEGRASLFFQGWV